MCLQPGEEIGNEVHGNVDQFFRIEQGEAKFILNGSEEYLARSADAVVIPAGTWHNVINTSSTQPPEALHGLLTAEPSRGHHPQDEGGSRSR